MVTNFPFIADPLFSQLNGARCLVTGGAGAIGCNLVRALEACGAAVTVLDDCSSGFSDNLSGLGVRIVNGDVADARAVEEAFGSRLDFIFHLAAQFANQNSVDHPLSDLRTNVAGTLQLLERARAIKLKKFVYASSSCVLGGHGGILSENTPLHPDTPYAVSKLAGEYYTRMYSELHGIPTTVIRYFNVFGPGERPGRYRNVLPNFAQKALDGETLTITGTGEETREFVYVADAVQGTIRAGLVEAARNGCFHIGSGQVLTILDLAQRILRATGSASAIEFQPRRHWDVIPHRRTDFSAARKTLGYSPLVAFDDGLEATVKWLRNRAGPKIGLA
jgi:UDP-glucose 4-epimerase